MAEEVKSQHVSIDDLVREVQSKKAEAKAITQANETVAKENNIAVSVANPEEIPHGEKVLSCIGYIYVLFILPLILKQDSAFCQHHAKQSMVIFVFFLLLGFTTKLMGKYYLGSNIVVSLLWFGLALYGMVLAWKGQNKDIPLVGAIARQLKW